MSSKCSKAINALATPCQLAGSLKFAFSEDQATYIAADVYQPLVTAISVLNEEIRELREDKDE